MTASPEDLDEKLLRVQRTPTTSRHYGPVVFEYLAAVKDVLVASAAPTARLSDDQFWALERWIIAHATAAAMAPGFHDPAQLQAIRDTAYAALVAVDSGGPSNASGSAVEP